MGGVMWTLYTFRRAQGRHVADPGSPLATIARSPGGVTGAAPCPSVERRRQGWDGASGGMGRMTNESAPAKTQRSGVRMRPRPARDLAAEAEEHANIRATFV